jgi:hypothetical protein
MKKLINDPRAVVREMLEGFVDLAPGQALLDSEDVVVRAGLPPYDARREVALVSGGTRTAIARSRPRSKLGSPLSPPRRRNRQRSRSKSRNAHG